MTMTLTVESVCREALDLFQPQQPGAFYGHPKDLSPGAGLVFSNIQIPAFNPETNRYEIRKMTCLIITHECDISPENNREFSDYFVCLPLMSLEETANTFAKDGKLDYFSQLLKDIVKGSVYRVMYLPPFPLKEDGNLRHGALLYWARATSGHVSIFNSQDVVSICALSEYGMTISDQYFQRNFLRPKSQQLPRTR